MSSILVKLLNHYGLDMEGYRLLTAEPSFSNIPLLSLEDAEVAKSVSLVKDAIRKHTKTLIYGDYDCDGVMSTSIMAKTFRKLGGQAATYLPSRYVDGYGLTLENARKIVSAGYGLVILVDNGISAYEGVSCLKDAGIDVLVLDHHELGEKMPEATAILHPVRLAYGEEPISAGYLSFLFSVALLGEKNDYLMCLGALSTLSDMMPLKAHNREIVRLMMETLKGDLYPQFSFLLDGDALSYNSISLNVIPAINAIGRMQMDTTVNRLVSYFVEDDVNRIASLASWMKGINAERKELTKQAFASVVTDDSPANVFLSDLREGLNGILANNIMGTNGKPTVVFSQSHVDPNVLVGSARSRNGCNIIDAYSELSDILVTCGGHAFAGGLSIKKGDLDTFKERFNSFVSKHPIEDKDDSMIEAAISDIDLHSLSIVDSLAPFGQGWPEPVFDLGNVDSSILGYSKDGRYLSCKVGPETRLFSFKISRESVGTSQTVHLKGTLRLNEWKNLRNVDVICDLVK